MKILYIMSSYNIYGGTPKKTLDLLKYFKNDASFYAYSDGNKEFKSLFEDTGASVYEGAYGRNLFLHLKHLLKIIDKDKIDIIQTQFSMGEILSYFIKLFRPHVKLIVAFVGSIEPQGIKKEIVKHIYKKADTFVFISNYVKNEKYNQFSLLKNKQSKIIFNGTEKRQATDDDFSIMQHPSLFSASGLIDIKNISLLIDALNILKEKGFKQLFLYIAGDGPERSNIEDKIYQYGLEQQVFLLGYQVNIGALLEQTDIYVHPCYVEGFGIAVAEAMMAEKPMIVANAGALPELIEDGKSGLIVDPFDANAWAEAISLLIDNKKMAKTFGENAKKKAQVDFSISKYTSSYRDLYLSLMDKK